MQGFERVYVDRQCEVLRTGRDRFFLKLKGGLVYAHPGIKEITKTEAENLVEERIAARLERGLQALEAGQKAEASAPESKKEVNEDGTGQ